MCGGTATRPRPGTASKWKTDWLWWVAGGYCASALIFNVADGLNHFLVPPTFFDDDTLVTKMVNPDEGRGVASILVGGVAPCVTAPWWAARRRSCIAAFCCGRSSGCGRARRRDGGVFLIVCGAPPVADGGAAARGFGATWSYTRLASGNLLVPIAIHARVERAGVCWDCARVAWYSGDVDFNRVSFFPRGLGRRRRRRQP